MSSEPTILIHGDLWERTYIEEEVAVCRTHTWRRERWHRRPALVHRSGGCVSLYHGQTFDPAKIDLVPDGWSHDHCAICWWTIDDTNDEQHSVGYTDERGDWVCSECYQQFLAMDSKE